MVKLNPEILDLEGTASEGEINLYRKLQESKHGGNWTAIHSLNIFPRSGPTQTEADFVILAPGLGILVVEVKAHRQIELRNGIWYLTGKRANRSPVVQANKAVFFLLEYLKERGIETKDIPVSFVVWFTNIPKGSIPDSIEVNPAGFLGAEDMNKDVALVLENILKINAEHLGRKLAEQTAPAKLLEQVLKILRPNFEVAMKPKALENEVEKWLETALEEQIQLVRMLEFAPSVLVEGIAGTGKTHIALHEAKQAHLRGERTLFICYNKLLAKYLRAALIDFPLVTVTTIHKLFLTITGLNVPADADQTWWQSDLPSSALDQLADSEYFAAFDTLIVDEAQDVALPAYLQVLDLLLVSGLSRSKLRLFGDFQNQGIYIPGTQAIENLKTSVSNLLLTPKLDVNCRNSRNLGTEIMVFLDEPNAYSGYRRKDDSPGMRIYMPESNAKIPHFVAEEMRQLLKTFTPEQIVILSSSRQELANLAKSIPGKLCSIANPAAGAVRFGTIQEFKGLEALAVLLVEFDGTVSPSWQTFYIGATRSTSSFSFVIPAATISQILESR
jgi:Nuclease-related domain/AAA domain